MNRIILLTVLAALFTKTHYRNMLKTLAMVGVFNLAAYFLAESMFVFIGVFVGTSIGLCLVFREEIVLQKQKQSE